MSGTDICFLTALELLSAYRKRSLSPVEVCRALLERIERLNPKINAYITVTAESALEQARAAEAAYMRGEYTGALLGVPVSIKDLVPTAGVRTTYGSLFHEDYVPEHDAVAVRRLKQAGAVILGKTNTPEFGHKGSTNNRVVGATHNPWKQGKTPGGSSGGAGAAVAAGLGPLAVGTDGGGSIRKPAVTCGIFGLKPQYGRVARESGTRGLGDLSHTGPMTRTVRDAALMLGVLAGPDESDRLSLPAAHTSWLTACEGGVEGLRIAWSPDLGYAVVEDEVRRVTGEAVARLRGLGCAIEEVTLDWTDPADAFVVFYTSLFQAAFGERLKEAPEKFDPSLRRVLEEAPAYTGADFAEAVFTRGAFWDQVYPLFERYDLLLTPVTAVTPFPTEANGPESVAGRKDLGPLAWMPFTYPFNMTGQPAAALPCGFDGEGLPVGLQIVGRRYDEATVLRAAAAFEDALGLTDIHPDLGWAGA